MPQLGAVALVGLALTAAQTGMQMKAAQDEAKAAQEAAEFNARQQELAGSQAREQASLQAASLAKQGRSVISAQRAAASGGGLQLGTGSLQTIADKTANDNRMDQLAMIYGSQLSSARATSEASLLRSQGAGARQAGKTAVAGTLLQGAAAGGGQYARARGY